MASSLYPVEWLPPNVLHQLFTEGLTPMWRSEGGWIWHPKDGWLWRAGGGWVVVSRRRLWNVFRSACAEQGIANERWIQQEPPPEPLSPSERRDLNTLLQQSGSLRKEDAKALIGGNTERFRKIWRCFPKHLKLNPGRQEGYRLSDAAVHLLRLRKK